MGEAPRPRVFVSYRAGDRARVQPLVDWLRGRGLAAFIDVYEIEPGDSIVDRLEAGIAAADAGLVLLSRSGIGDRWTHWELSVMMTRRIEGDGFRLIPVLLDPDAPVPLALRALRRVPVEDREELLATLLGRSLRPPLGDPPDFATPSIYRLDIAAASERGFALTLRGPDAPPITATTESRLDTLADLADLGALSGDADQHPRASRLARVGKSLGALIFPAAIAAGLPQRRPYQLRLSLADPALAALPFEAAWIEELRPIALEAGVEVGREITALARAMPPQPGPLRVLVVIASPDRGGATLDTSHELQVVLDALEPVRGHAEVAVLDGEDASLAGLRRRIHDQRPHVVHVSAHGQPGRLLLEGVDGRADPVGPPELAAACMVGGVPVPLVVLSACSSGVADAAGGGFAHALVAAGVPQVIAMQHAVGDAYATELAGHFYRLLAAAPVAVHALTLARQEAESARLDRLRRGERSRSQDPEYATPVFLARVDVWDAPLFDASAPPRTITPVAAPVVAGLSVRMQLGDFVGRIGLRRRLRAAVTGSGRAGAVLWGMGGIGKSSLALDLLQRLVLAGWRPAVPEAMTAGELYRAVIRAGRTLVTTDRRADLRDLLGAGADEQDVAEAAAALITAQPIVLLLDDLHAHATIDRRRLDDRALVAAITTLAAHARAGAVLVTSRHRLTDLTPLVDELHVGPLDDTELQLLLWRLPALGALTEALAIARSVGGHPRVLEFVDALVRTTDGARFPHVRARLLALEEAHAIDLPLAGDPDVTVADRVAAARTLAAADVLLHALLADLDAPTVDLLRAIAVFGRPVPDGGALAVAAPAEPAATRRRLRQLRERTLVGSLERDGVERWQVHRWTAEEIWSRTGARPPGADRAAARWWLGAEEGRVPEAAAFAALEHWLAAGELDEAVKLAKQLAKGLETWGRTSDALALCTRMLGVIGGRPRDRAQFRLAAADLLLVHGRHGEAMEAAADAETTLRALAADAPEPADLLRDVADAISQRADIHFALGHGADARALLEEAVAVMRDVAGREPDRADLHGDLASAVCRLADLYRTLGNGGAARALYEEDLAITRRLAERDPERADVQRDLAISLNKLADLHRALGDVVRARTLYEQSLAIRLADGERDRTDLQRALATSFERLADVHGALGDGVEARAFCEQSFAIRRRLAKQDPKRTDLQRDLAVAFNKLGEIHRDLGNLAEARGLYRDGLAIRRRLADHAPDRADLQHDLAISCDRLADVHRAAGENAEADALQDEAVGIARRVAAREPDHADFQRSLSTATLRLADVRVAAGDAEGARALYEESVAVSRRLASREPARTDLQRDLSVSVLGLADFLRATGHTDEARALYLQDLATARELAEREPDRADLQRDLAVSFERMAAVEETAASTWLGSAVALWRALVARDPTRVGHQRGLATALLMHGGALGDPDGGASLAEGATMLVALRRAGRLEAAHHALADALAPLVDAATAGQLDD